MAFEKESREEKDTFVDALEDSDFLDENNKLKIFLEESKITIETLSGSNMILIPSCYFLPLLCVSL